MEAKAPEAPSITSLLVTLVVLTLGLIIAFYSTYLKQIGANFAQHRCNPAFMPFASLFGYDTSENFQFCLGAIFQSRVAEVFAPIFKILEGFTSILNTITNVALGIRKLFSNFLLTVNGFIANVRDRIEALMFQVRLLLMRMKELMGKVYGTMYAVMWMGLSGISAGKNMAENDLVKFMMEFCFDPATPVLKADGSWVPISELKLGDILAPTAANPTPTVTSVFTFDGAQTPMVRIGDVSVSASHYVQYRGHWLEAEDHPDAVPTVSLPVLSCLNVSGHEFVVGRAGLVAADYDEHEDSATVAATQRLAAGALNGVGPKGIAVVEDYSIGLDPTASVRMADGSWRLLTDIALGDIIWNAGAIKGIVWEQCDSTVQSPTGCMAAAQLVFSPSAMAWTRAAHLFSRKDAGTVALLHLITETTGVLEIKGKGHSSLFVRDYREVALPDMESAYQEAFERKNAQQKVECVRTPPLVPS
jgi:hypothetical protein